MNSDEPQITPLHEIIARLQAGLRAAAERNSAYQEWRSTLGEPPRCPIHNLPRAVDEDATRRAWFDGRPTIHVHRCPECATRRALERAGVPARFLDCRLSNYRPSSTTDRAAVQRLQEIASGWCRRHYDPVVVVFCGTKPACGKTHLAVGLLAASMGPGMFVEEYTLVNSMRDNHDGTPRRSLLAAAQRARILVLDAVGTALEGRDLPGLYYALVDWRTSRYLPMIITTSLAIPAFTARLGPQAAQRLRTINCQVFSIGGSNPS